MGCGILNQELLDKEETYSKKISELHAPARNNRQLGTGVSMKGSRVTLFVLETQFTKPDLLLLIVIMYRYTQQNTRKTITRASTDPETMI